VRDGVEGSEEEHPVIDHFTLKVSDYSRSKPFYVAALKPLGYAVAMEYGGGCGMGATPFSPRPP
jgi:hypothetical protein